MAEKTEKKGIEITDIPTEISKAFKLPDGETVDVTGYLAWLGNQILEIKKAVS